MFEKNNNFEKWWSEHDYSEFHKYDCLDAYNAGELNGYKKANEELKEENNKLLDVINNQEVKIADLEKEIEQFIKG